MSENVNDIKLSNPIDNWHEVSSCEALKKEKKKKYLAKALKEFNKCIDSCDYKDYEKEEKIFVHHFSQHFQYVLKLTAIPHHPNVS